MESILTLIKKLAGNLEEENIDFDEEIISDINTVFSDLWEMGVGPSEPFYIEDKTSVWTDFMPEVGKLESVKTYIHLRVKLMFDPPQSQSLIASIERQIDKLEWRLSVAPDMMKQS